MTTHVGVPPQYPPVHEQHNSKSNISQATLLTVLLFAPSAPFVPVPLPSAVFFFIATALQ